MLPPRSEMASNERARASPLQETGEVALETTSDIPVAVPWLQAENGTQDRPGVMERAFRIPQPGKPLSRSYC